jgi:hypothetical protein
MFFSGSLEKQSLTLFPIYYDNFSNFKMWKFNYLDLRNYRNKREAMLETIYIHLFGITTVLPYVYLCTSDLI